MNHRVKKTYLGTVTTSFFNKNWQELESATSEQTSVYVWGLRYIDDLVLRDKGQERLYSLADPNWNVVAIANTSGTILERMKYDAFGKITWMNAAFATIASSGYAWFRTFTSQVLDYESGLILYRNRYYNTGLGRFVTRDPIGYRGKDVNLFRYVNNSPLIFTDVSGLNVDKKLCDDFRKSNKNEDVNRFFGWVLCTKDGGRIPCVNEDVITNIGVYMDGAGTYTKITDPTAFDIVAECVKQHEVNHMAKGECPKNKKCPTPMKGDNRQECLAFEKTLKCLDANKNCPSPPNGKECRRQVNHFRIVAVHKCHDHCQAAGMARPGACKY